MTKLIYISHPSVVLSKEMPIHMWHLSDKGKEAVERLIELPFWKEVDSLYSSTETKAIEVAESISKKYKLSFETFDELKEANRGSTGFIPYEEYMKAIQLCYKDPDNSYKGWETHRNSMSRNVEKLNELIEKNLDKTLAIIGHGGAGTLIKCWLKGKEPDYDEDPKRTGCYWIANIDKMEIIQDWKEY